MKLIEFEEVVVVDEHYLKISINPEFVSYIIANKTNTDIIVRGLGRVTVKGNYKDIKNRLTTNFYV